MSIKLKTLSVFIAFICVACSGEDIQLNLEKAKSSESKPTQKHVNNTLEKNLKSNAPREQNAQTTLDTERPLDLVDSQNSLKDNSVERVNHIMLKNDINIGFEQGTSINPESMRELETSLAKIDDTGVMAVYGEKGSGINLILGGTDLSNGSVALAVSKRNLVSNVTSVNGANSIVSAPSGFGFTIGLSGDYLFEFDKDTLTPKAQTALESVLTLYKDYEGENIEVAGHTDAKGLNDYNLDLSKRRANSVKQWFVEESVDSALISTQGYGETKPVAKNLKNGEDYPEGRTLNRRVEIIIKTKKKVNYLPTVSKSSEIVR